MHKNTYMYTDVKAQLLIHTHTHTHSLSLTHTHVKIVLMLVLCIIDQDSRHVKQLCQTANRWTWLKAALQQSGKRIAAFRLHAVAPTVITVGSGAWSARPCS